MRCDLSEVVDSNCCSRGFLLLTEFDQNTMANMTAALEYVCKRIPSEKDTYDFRKRIADAMVECAKSGKRGYVDLQNTGMRELDELLRRPGFGHLWSRWLLSLPWRKSK
jgi:hypothetical protein